MTRSETGHWPAVKVLIVEDDAMLAFDLADQITAAGFTVLGVATTVSQAMGLCEQCDIAVIDVHLGGETSERIAARLRAIGTPFLVVTGYAPDEVPDPFHAGFILGKPIETALLAQQMERLAARRR